MEESTFSSFFSLLVAFSAAVPILYFSREIQEDCSPALNQAAKNLISYDVKIPKMVAWITYFDAFCDNVFGEHLVSAKSIATSAIFTHLAIIVAFFVLYFSGIMDDEIEPGFIFTPFIGLFYLLNILTDFISFCFLRFLLKFFKKLKAILFCVLPFITLVSSMCFVAISLIIIDILLDTWPEAITNAQYFLDWISWRFSSVLDALHYIFFPSDIIGLGEGYYTSWEYGVWWVIVVSTLWPFFLFSLLIYGGISGMLIISCLGKMQLLSVLFDQDKPVVAIGWSVSLVYWFMLTVSNVIYFFV
ncbi:hypothetical protein [Halomonas sp. DN3]|uniref:hypothetical protein n=1 Tax=Halomonas sp. DN3 TaxID=2953657 RepID=UPI00209FA089|nr:hypothetical protein [Halomonas sp. DN3]USZ51074.1 hypothetical protein NKF27_06125 [Halomonas sp. DN3]